MESSSGASIDRYSQMPPHIQQNIETSYCNGRSTIFPDTIVNPALMLTRVLWFCNSHWCFQLTSRTLAGRLAKVSSSLWASLVKLEITDWECISLGWESLMRISCKSNTPMQKKSFGEQKKNSPCSNTTNTNSPCTTPVTSPVQVKIGFLSVSNTSLDLLNFL